MEIRNTNMENNACDSFKNGMQCQSGKFCYTYPRPALTSDCVIFGFDGITLKILLIERGLDPFKGSWALPGGFMKMNETIEECARRELKEETNLDNVFLEQFHVFSDVGRDSRGRIVTVAFIALVRPSDYVVAGGDDALRAMWFDADMLPPLAFDHDQIIRSAKKHLKEILRLRPVAFKLLDELFSVDDLRKVYEAVNGTQYDRRNFQRKLMQSNVVEEVSLNKDQISFPSVNSDCIIDMKSSIPVESMRSKESKSVGRKISRLLKLKKNIKYDEENDNFTSDSSIKDLFNF